MTQQVPTSKRQMIWVNIGFFAFTHIVSLIGVPWYLYHHSLPLPTLALAMFYSIATGMGITAGYHRLFSHNAYKAHPLVEFLFLFFGAAAFEQSALAWSAQHRDHHRFVDTEEDPYSIKKGFFYAHIGWLIFWKHVVHYENAPDLQKNPRIVHQHRFYLLWAISAGVLFPIVLGALWHDALGAFIFAVCLRLVTVHHATFCINSICHMFGRSTYDIHATAKDHWFIAFLTNGEGYHNFHHRFPADYRNGVRWYQWDPTKWLIASLRFIGLAYELKRVSKFRILEARLRADQQRVREWFLKAKEPSRWTQLSSDLEIRYDHLLQTLAAWELKSHEYRDLLRDTLRKHSDNLCRFAEGHRSLARQKFEQELQQWRVLVHSNAGLARLVF